MATSTKGHTMSLLAWFSCGDAGGDRAPILHFPVLFLQPLSSSNEFKQAVLCRGGRVDLDVRFLLSLTYTSISVFRGTTFPIHRVLKIKSAEKPTPYFVEAAKDTDPCTTF